MTLPSHPEPDSSSWGTSLISTFTNHPFHVTPASYMMPPTLQSRRNDLKHRQVRCRVDRNLEDGLWSSFTTLSLSHRGRRRALTPQDPQPPPAPPSSRSQTPNNQTPGRISPPAPQSRTQRSEFLRAVTSGPRGLEAREQTAAAIARREARREARQLRRRMRAPVYRPTSREERGDLPPQYTERDPHPLLLRPPPRSSPPATPEIPPEETRRRGRLRYRRNPFTLDRNKTGTRSRRLMWLMSLRAQRRRWKSLGPLRERERVRSIENVVGDEVKERVGDVPGLARQLLKRWRIRRAKRKLAWLQEKEFLSSQERMLVRELRG